MLAPSSLFFLPAPEDLLWTGGRAERRFSPSNAGTVPALACNSLQKDLFSPCSQSICQSIG